MSLSALKSEFKRLFAVLEPPDHHHDNSILLTFDDGPHPEITPQILDILDEFRAKAIFFVVGNRIPGAPHLLRQILDRGHILGNHSFSHNKKFGFSGQRIDFTKCQAEVKRMCNYSPFLMRPPEGKLTGAILYSAFSLDLKIVLWSIDPEDWKLRTPSVAAENARQLATMLLAKQRRREILLFHDDNVNTIVYLRTLLPKLRDAGCVFDAGLFDNPAGR